MANENDGAYDLRRSNFPRIGLKRDVARIDALRSKLVSPVEGSLPRSNRPIQSPDWTVMQRLSDDTAMDIRDVSNLLQLLPDTELAMQILVSSILSPKDMLTTELLYRVDGERFTSELTGALLGVIKDHFENEHKITDVLTPMLEDALFKTGSYPIAILPESTIDDAINNHARVAKEDIGHEFDVKTKELHSIGFLGNPSTSQEGMKQTPSMESFFETQRPSYSAFLGGTGFSLEALKFRVIDNFNSLKLPILRDKMRQDQIQELLKVRNMAFESYSPDKNESIYRLRQYKYMPVLTMRDARQSGKKNFGHPLVMHLPSEAVIPVHVPGTPEQHLGYFILQDENGNPLSHASEVDYYQQMGTNLATNSVAQGMSNDIQRLHNAMFGTNDNKSDETRELERLYADIVERELVSRLQAGVYGEEVAIGRDPEFYRIMLARASKQMRTQMLYIPRELLIYVAFDYNQFGIGQSLMSKSKILAGLRAMLLLADTKAALKNAIGRTQLKIGLDEKDPDPSKTVEFSLHEYAKVNAGAFPLGVGNPQDLLNYLQRASIDVEVSGNSRYPATTFDVEDVQSNKARPDQELQNNIRKQHIQSFGLSPESVDQSQGPDFATSVVSNNLLMSKRILQYQIKVSGFMTDYVRTYTFNSETLMSELKKILKENFDKLTEEQKEVQTEGQVQAAADSANVTADSAAQAPSSTAPTPTSHQTKPELSEDEVNIKKRYMKTRFEELKKMVDESGWEAVLTDFVTSIFVELPAPDMLALTEQLKAYDAYKQGIESAISAYIDAEFITDGVVGAQLAPYVDTIKKTLIAYYLRRYLRENNILPELDELTTFDEEDGPAINLLAIQEDHIEAIAKGVLGYATALDSYRKKVEQAASGLGGETANNSDSSLGSSATGGSDTGGGGDDFGLDAGMDDLNDMGSDGEKSDTAETKTSETSETTETSSTSSDGSSSSSTTSTNTTSGSPPPAS